MDSKNGTSTRSSKDKNKNKDTIQFKEVLNYFKDFLILL